MAKNIITPGVYIEEKNAFPNSIVPVATAVPAFIGYTEKATFNNKDYTNIPTRISSLAEYQAYFGGAPQATFSLEATSDAARPYALQFKSGRFFLYYSMQLFFANGGATCYIVSIGNYNQLNVAVTDFYEAGETQLIGINALKKEAEPTLLVIPDAMLFDFEQSAMLHRNMLEHCEQMASRFAILDAYMDMRDGKDEQTPNTTELVDAYRAHIGSKALQWGAAYYPWVRTTVIPAAAINYDHIDVESLPLLEELLAKENQEQLGDRGIGADRKKEVNAVIKKIGVKKKKEEIAITHKELLVVSPLYKTIINSIQEKLNLLPPSGAIAGIYSMIDNTRGVFKAPANVSLNAVIQPFVNINDAAQEFLNVPPDGKAVNAIRSFPGKGVLVWGARTLDGNNNEYRYVSVRRTVIFVEQSIKYGIQAYVFEPNTHTTWTIIRALIENFLTSFWQQGGLMGATSKDAFFVQIGLGSTMTQQDVLDGILRVSVGVATVRPAEFLIIHFQQKMQAGGA